MLGVLASGGAPTTNQQADGLAAFNSLLDSWRTERLMVFALQVDTLTLTSTKQNYTIGFGGDLNITRPTKFESAYLRVSSVDTPVRIIDQLAWNSIPYKANAGPIPEFVFYNPTMAGNQGILQVYPVPNAANVLYLTSWVDLLQLTALTDTITLPPGYDRAIASNMAIEIAPEYPGVTVTPELQRTAMESKAAIKRMNITPIRMGSELARIMPGHHGSSRILTGP